MQGQAKVQQHNGRHAGQAIPTRTGVFSFSGGEVNGPAIRRTYCDDGVTGGDGEDGVDDAQHPERERPGGRALLPGEVARVVQLAEPTRRSPGAQTTHLLGHSIGMCEARRGLRLKLKLGVCSSSGLACTKQSWKWSRSREPLAHLSSATAALTAVLMVANAAGHDDA